GDFQYLKLATQWPHWGKPSEFERRAYYSPSYYAHYYGTQIFQVFVASAGFLREAGVEQELYVGIPLDKVTKGNWKQVPLEVVVFDSLWNELVRVNTTLEDACSYADPGVEAILIRELNVSLPPGNYVVAVAVPDSVSGTLGLGEESMTVPRLSRDSLSISDIKLAYLVPHGYAGAAGGTRILPNPSETYFAPSPPKLYYEVYNLAPDRDGRYRFVTKYSMIPTGKTKGGFWSGLTSLFGLRQPYILSSFGREVGSPSSAEQLSIDLSALRDGAYHLVLEVEDSVSRQSARVERSFQKFSSLPSSGASAK
ncbi:MAG: hypothetical protein V2A71_02700, partial [Candidatus Eisenbacteria bacterium]